MSATLTSRQRTWLPHRLSIALGVADRREKLALLAKLAGDVLPEADLEKLESELTTRLRIHLDQG